MVAGANGTNGVPVLRQSVVYKQEQESVIIQNQHMVEKNVMEPKQSWGSVTICPAAMKVDINISNLLRIEFAIRNWINWTTL